MKLKHIYVFTDKDMCRSVFLWIGIYTTIKIDLKKKKFIC